MALVSPCEHQSQRTKDRGERKRVREAEMRKKQREERENNSAAAWQI